MTDKAPASGPSAAPRQPDDLVTIEIAKEAMNFSAGHFTMFSAAEREDLHGHNWRVACEVTTPVGAAGLCFDYNIIKRRLKALVDELDEKMLLPGISPWLRVEQDDPWVIAVFADERIPFLPRDVLVLDLRNVSVEELAGWFVTRLLAAEDLVAEDIRALRVGVSSGTNQWGWRAWRSA